MAKKFFLPILISLLGGLWFLGAKTLQGQDLLWQWNFDAATERANRTNRLILAAFTGSDWNEPSRVMATEVTGTPQFLDYASSTLILLQLDFPHVTNQPAIQKEQNEKLLQAYRVDFFPTYLLLDPKGRIVWRHVGLYPGGVIPFLDHIRAAITTKNLLDGARGAFLASDTRNLDLLAQRHRYSRLQDLFQKADQVGLVDDLHWVVSEGVAMDEQLKEGFFYTQKVRHLLQEGNEENGAKPFLDKVLEWDSGNQKHYREEVELHSLLAPVDRFKRPTDHELLNLAYKIASLTISIPNISPLGRFRFHMMAGDFSAMGGSVTRAIGFYEVAVGLAPNLETRSAIEGMVRRLKGEPMDSGAASGSLLLPPPPLNGPLTPAPPSMK